MNRATKLIELTVVQDSLKTRKSLGLAVFFGVRIYFCLTQHHEKDCNRYNGFHLQNEK